MAGKRQHYIPRFLQRGFLHDPNENAERTWLYRRNVAPCLVGIRDVGVEEYFYSQTNKSGSKTLDDVITTLEGALSFDIVRLRDLPLDSDVSGRMVATLVVHLVRRTAHIRSVFTEGCTQIVDEISKLCGNPSRLRSILKIDAAEMSETLQEAFNSALHDLPFAQLGIPANLARRIVEFAARERFEQFFLSHTEIMQSGLARVLDGLSERIRDTHNKTLSDNLSDDGWINDLALFDWKIVHTNDEIILSDCVAMALEINSNDYVPLLFAKRDRIRCVVLPISSKQLLVGALADNFQLDLARYNSGAASCSDSFFIAKSSTAGAAVMHLIGGRAGEIITQSINDAIAEMEVGNSETISKSDRHTGLISQTGSSIDGFTYSMHLQGFSDKKTADNVVALTKIIVRVLSTQMTLFELDGITFAANYDDALKTFDRGDLPIHREEPRRPGYGTPIAKTISVHRDGTPKIHLIFDASVGMALCSDVEATRMHATYLLAKMLAYVAHTTTYERTQPAQDSISLDAVASILHPWSYLSSSAYFTARVSACVDPAAGEIFSELVTDSLIHAKEVIREARLAYRVDADMDKLLSVSLPAVSSVLKHCAEWLGHRDGLPEGQPYLGDDLLLRLSDEDLKPWLGLLSRDLCTLYDVEGDLDSARIINLSKHLERLLWTMQIFPWPNDDGTAYISVPFGEDIAELEKRGMS